MTQLSGPKLNVLIVDDDQVCVDVLTALLARMGHSSISAPSGERALELFVDAKPDVVLLDLFMPGLGGEETAARLRQLMGRHWVPIIVVSVSSADKDRTRAMMRGADGYLAKPISYEHLASKIEAMQRIKKLQQQLEYQLHELEAYRERITEEQRLARHLMKHMAPEPKFEGVDFWIRAADEFSGDYVSAIERPNGLTYAILADAMGHGLASTVSLIPVFTTFDAMAKKDLPLDQIARELNIQLKRRTPTERFVAVTLALIDAQAGSIEVWNGGNPPALIHLDNERMEKVGSRHPPMGLLSEERFDAHTDLVLWRETCHLMMVSDGAVEAVDPNGRLFGVEAIQHVLQSESKQACARLKEALLAHLDDHAPTDDLSILTLNVKRTHVFQPRLLCQAGAPNATSGACSRSAQVQLMLGPEQLRELDVGGLVNELRQTMKWPRSIAERVTIVLNELMINAIDHGVLALNSRIKDLPDGMDRYLELRETRLRELDSGYLEITIQTLAQACGGGVMLMVESSGQGFDFSALYRAEQPTNKVYGRGLDLVRSFTNHVTFENEGRRIRAHLMPDVAITLS